MAVADLISVEQYLRTSFEHDAEFVEGRIVERSAPTYEHSIVQVFLIGELRAIGRRLGLITLSEPRVQTSSDHFRVPDVCIITERPEGEFGRRNVIRPPYLCVEILSPDDSMEDALAKVREYLAFGVEWVWVIDPVALAGQVHSRSTVANVEDKIFSTDRFSIDLSNVEF